MNLIQTAALRDPGSRASSERDSPGNSGEKPGHESAAIRSAPNGGKRTCVANQRFVSNFGGVCKQTVRK